MTALCLDLGTKCGWAIIRDGKVSASGTRDLSPKAGDVPAVRFQRFISFLRSSVEGLDIDGVYYEQIVRSHGDGHTSVASSAVYFGLLACLQLLCREWGLREIGINPSAIKMHATGKGNSPKALVIDSVRAKSFWPKDDNEADAIALALLMISTGGVAPERTTKKPKTTREKNKAKAQPVLIGAGMTRKRGAKK